MKYAFLILKLKYYLSYQCLKNYTYQASCKLKFTVFILHF